MQGNVGSEYGNRKQGGGTPCGGTLWGNPSGERYARVQLERGGRKGDSFSRLQRLFSARICRVIHVHVLPVVVSFRSMILLNYRFTSASISAAVTLRLPN
jgi:hypothetical protein